MVLVVQNISINTLGVLNASSANMDWKASICKVLRMPTVYMVPLAFVLKVITYDMTRSFFWPVLNYAKNALIPITLISLVYKSRKCLLELVVKKCTYLY